MDQKNFSKTQEFNNLDKITKSQAKDILLEVCNALKEKGYNPVNQIVGYILSDDPTYITNYKNARVLITKLERDDLLEEIVNTYINNLVP